MYIFNPLSAKLSFQVWYPGGQRLKAISFSWSGVQSPSKCFSNTESTSIIASRDEKRCYAAVQWNQIGALKFVTLGWPTPEVSRMTASLRSPPRCSLTDLQMCVNVQENSEVQNGSDIGSPKQASAPNKTRWFCKRWRVDTSRNHTLTSLFVFVFSFGPWITASDSYRSRGWSTILLRSISPTSGSLVIILVFDVTSRKCFAQPGDHHSCQASDTGSALKK